MDCACAEVNVVGGGGAECGCMACATQRARRESAAWTRAGAPGGSPTASAWVGSLRSRCGTKAALAAGLTPPRPHWRKQERPVDLNNARALAVNSMVIAGVARAFSGTPLAAALPAYGGGASNSDYGFTSIGPVRCGSSASTTIRWSEVALLAGQNALDLGPTSWEAAVAAALTAGIEPDFFERVRLAVCLEDRDGIDDAIDMTLVRRVFFSEWEARRADATFLSDLIVAESAARPAGLNATDSDGYYSRAVLYALSLWHTFPELGEEPLR